MLKGTLLPALEETFPPHRLVPKISRLILKDTLPTPPPLDVAFPPHRLVLKIGSLILKDNLTDFEATSPVRRRLQGKTGNRRSRNTLSEVDIETTIPARLPIASLNRQTLKNARIVAERLGDLPPPIRSGKRTNDTDSVLKGSLPGAGVRVDCQAVEL